MDDRRPLLLSTSSESDWSCPPTAQQTTSQARKRRSPTGKCLIAIFVVSFDTRHGNLVEWSYPQGRWNLDGLEFKALASGLHSVSQDFIYFKFLDWFGLSCYQKLAVDSVAERGVRMKCVGVLAEDHGLLHLHMPYLQQHVRHLLESTGDYSALEEYYRHCSVASSPTSSEVPLPITRTAPACESQKGAIPMSSGVTDFLQDFGPNAFVLWKLALLQKRILFCTPPPVGRTCLQVRCTCLMTALRDGTDVDMDAHPIFYISVSDIDLLKSKRTYIACTTERILQSKEDLFDVFVMDGSLTCRTVYNEPLLRLTRQDQARFRQLAELHSSKMANNSDGVIGATDKREQTSAEHGFVSFFADLNHNLFALLARVAQTGDHVLTAEHIAEVGLDPEADRHFLTNLALLHGFDLTVQRPQDMCCLFNCF